MKGIGTTPIDIRFIDAKENESDHPWRRRYVIDSTNFTYDGFWKHIRIPLNDFKEQGAWDNNTWYNPENKFDWSKTDRFEIDSEYGEMGSSELWFDNIKITDPNEALSADNNINKNISFQLLQNYPNPFNPLTKIRYIIAEKSFVTLNVYDILGREAAVLVNGEKNAGSYEVNFNASGLPSGVYFYRLNSQPEISREANYQAVKKLMLVK
ncbi:MAG: T9SS type A sorting domain-containing protein [Ignavibacteriaceae bacterium]